MRSIWGAILLAALGGIEAAAVPGYISKIQSIRNGFYPLDVVDKLEESTMPTWMDKKIKAGKNSNYTLENAAVRREWCVVPVAARPAAAVLQ